MTAGVACGVGLVVAVIEREAVATLAVDAVRFALNYPSRTRRAQTQDDQTPFARVAASQLGYGPLMQKRFTSPRAFTSFRVIDESTGSSVFSGGAPAASVHTTVLGPFTQVWTGDFSELQAPGRYHIVLDDGATSYPFEISPNVFDPAIRAVQRAFYFQRAFTSVDAAHAEGPWTHADDSDRAPAGIRRGWHDAGDFSIYNAQMASTLFWLLEAYADFAPVADDTNIPESGNGMPDLLDEARWGLDWMRSMQEASGGFRNTTCFERYGPYGTNGHDVATSPNAPRTYVVGETGTIPTARAVGTLAYASAIFRASDSRYADELLAAARRGWEYVAARPDEHSDGPTCPASRQDGDAVVGRHVRAYAAAAMLLATGDEAFGQAYDAHIDNLDNDPSTYRTNIYAALLIDRATAASPRRDTAQQRLARHASQTRDDAAAHPFEWSGRYIWGSVNAGFERAGAFVVKPCLANSIAARDDCEAAAANVHYAFGRNLYQLSYINGVPGVSHSHERSFHQWLATLNASPFLFPGLVAGGPNEKPEIADDSNPHARPIPVWGYWDDPAMPRDATTALDGRYTDNDSWSTNEVDIVWQASALYNLYFAQWLAHGGQPRTLARR
ncbi:MAG: glycoside hydrolase family 9 protein [Vicinamibacterales bacterium]